MLELKHISYSVREADETLGILKDISLTVDDHKLVVFTGPNGGGKTTLAKIIMGLVTPTEGQILWNGQDVTHMTITERAKLGISYGFQQPPRFKGITVRDLLTIASGDEKLSKDKCCQYLTKVGLCANDYLDREVDVSLSGGEVKRIEIASILARNADLMIFDEPEAGIDLWSFARLTETFEQIHSQGSATMIIISHQERIISLADEVIVVGDGTGGRIMNPQTVVYLEEGATIQMETVQIRGIDSTKRETKIVCGKDAEAVVTERLMTHGDQVAESDMEISLDGDGARGRVISRSVAKGTSRQVFYPKMVGNAACFGHVQCDSIIMDDAHIESIPAIVANSTEAQLIHEAAIGKIAGDQLLKLETLGLSPEEAEECILKGFLA